MEETLLVFLSFFPPLDKTPEGIVVGFKFFAWVQVHSNLQLRAELGNNTKLAGNKIMTIAK